MDHNILLVKIPSRCSYERDYTKYAKAHGEMVADMKAVGLSYDDELAAPTDESGSYFHVRDADDVIIDQDTFFRLCARGRQPEVKSVHVMQGMEGQIKSVEKLAREVTERLTEIMDNLPTQSYNSKCEVHVPGMALMHLNRTMLLEDSCTDSLQEALNNGWRIIAACPQPDQRRPDYILGRYEPEPMNVRNHDSAARNPNEK